MEFGISFCFECRQKVTAALAMLLATLLEGRTVFISDSLSQTLRLISGSDFVFLVRVTALLDSVVSD